MSSFPDWVRRVVLGRPDELTEALQLLDAKEAAAIADIRALSRRADEEINRIARRSLA
jgi:hypothetical protein